MTTNLELYRECLYFTLNTFTRSFNKVCEEAYETVGLGLSVSHGYCLMIALEKPGLLLKDIGEELCIAGSTVTRFVDALETKGYLKRKSSKDDGRAIRVFPTKKGESLKPKLVAAKEKMRLASLTHFSDEQIQEMAEKFTQFKDWFGQE